MIGCFNYYMKIPLKYVTLQLVIVDPTYLYRESEGAFSLYCSKIHYDSMGASILPLAQKRVPLNFSKLMPTDFTILSEKCVPG